MKVDLRDGRTLVVTPETTAEVLALQAFAFGSATIENPHLFAQNVPQLVVRPPGPEAT